MMLYYSFLFLYILKGQLFFRSNQKVKLLTEISYITFKNAEKWCYASAPEFPGNSVDTVVSTYVYGLEHFLITCCTTKIK